MQEHERLPALHQHRTARGFNAGITSRSLQCHQPVLSTSMLPPAAQNLALQGQFGFGLQVPRSEFSDPPVRFGLHLHLQLRSVQLPQLPLQSYQTESSSMV